MVVRYGRTVPDGFLAVYSVETEEEAEKLCTLACGRNYDGEFVSDSLARQQTLERLYEFGDKLHELYTKHKDYIQRKD